MICASKLLRQFLELCLKIKKASVCLLRLKTDRGCDAVGHASRSSGLIRVKASRARVSQSDIKTGGSATTSDARGTITKVASSLS
jgi:hypothetical protein